MKAAEVIELIKKLPPEERAVVSAFIQGLDCRKVGDEGVRVADRERSGVVARQVFDRHPELFRKLAQ